MIRKIYKGCSCKYYMGQGVNLSLRELLGNSYESYLIDVILSNIERLTKRGEISLQELRKLEDIVNQRGTEVLSPTVNIINSITKNTIESDGYVAEAVLKLTNSVEIRNFIKKFSKKEDLKHAVNVQSQIYKELGSDFGSSVPEIKFINSRRRIIISPFIDGATLFERLEKTEDKFDIVSDVVSDYVRLFSHLNRNDNNLKIPKRMGKSHLAFLKYYLNGQIKGNEELLRLFEEEIGRDLDSGAKYNIHGDLHPGNILLTSYGKVYIDWANSSSNGLFEYDIDKLLMKSDLKLEEENEIARMAARKFYDNIEERELSSRLHIKNQVLENLLAAKRYLKRSHDSDNWKKLNKMSSLFFEEAMIRLDYAIQSGIIKEEFKKKLSLPDTYTKESLTYEELKTEYNPKIQASQTNIIEPVINSESSNSYEIITNLEKKIKNSKRKRTLKKISVPAAIAFLACVTVGGLKYNEYLKERERKEAINMEKLADLSLDSYNHNFRRIYELATRQAAEGTLNSRFKIDNKVIDDVAAEYGLEAQLLRQIIRVNRIYAGIDFSAKEEFISISDINFLLPNPNYNNKGGRTMDPLENLKFGARILSDKLKEYNGDRSKALTDFYISITESTSFYGDIYKNPYDKIRDDVKILVHNVINGTGFGFDGGFCSIFLTKP